MSELKGVITRPDFISIRSTEISKALGKRHDHVLEDIRRIYKALDFDKNWQLGTYVDDKGRTYPCYYLDKKMALVLLTSYDTASRFKVIEHFINSGGHL